MHRFIYLIQSIRYLKPIQIIDRITRKFRKFRFYSQQNNIGLNNNLSEKVYQDHNIFVDNTCIKFGTYLVELKEIEEKYHDTSDLLVLYKLNYLDHLNAVSLSESQKYEALNKWMNNCKDLDCPIWDPFPCSVRSINILRLRNYGNYQSLLWLHYLIIDQFIEKHLLANHYLTNLKALYILSHLFNTSKKYIFRNELIKQLDQQFAVDGVYYEQSTGYHKQLHLDLLDLYNFTHSGNYHDAELSAICLELIHKSNNFLNEIDHDTIFNDVLTDFSPTVEDLRCYHKILIGTINVADVSKEKLKHFSVSKFAFAQKQNLKLACSAGKILCKYNPGHQHANFGSIEIWINSKKIITNSASSTYKVNLQRLRERSARYNNSLLINNEEIYQIFDSFKVANRPMVEQCVRDLKDSFFVRNVLIFNSFPWRRKRKIIRDLVLCDSRLKISDKSSYDTDVVQSFFNLTPGFEVTETTNNSLVIGDHETFFELTFDGHLCTSVIDIGIGHNRTEATQQLCITGRGAVNIEIHTRG